MANKKQPVVKVKMQEDLLRRLVVMSEIEGRSINNQITMLVRNAVAYHERAKGKLDTKAISAVDLSEFLEEESECWRRGLSLAGEASFFAFCVAGRAYSPPRLRRAVRCADCGFMPLLGAPQEVAKKGAKGESLGVFSFAISLRRGKEMASKQTVSACRRHSASVRLRRR